MIIKYLLVVLVVSTYGLCKEKKVNEGWNLSCTCQDSKSKVVPWQYEKDCCTDLRRVVWITFSVIFTIFVVWFFWNLYSYRKKEERDLHDYTQCVQAVRDAQPAEPSEEPVGARNVAQENEDHGTGLINSYGRDRERGLLNNNES
jgi:hypothetical protein